MGAWSQHVAVWVAVSYLIGAIPMGVLLARAKGIDIREVGSGNIGATNAARALGTKLGFVVLGLDALKAATPIWLARSQWALGNDADAQMGLALVAFAAIVGHIFPVYLKFRGGKGVACALGVFIAIDPMVALCGVVMYAQGIWLTRISAVGSLSAVTAITLAVLIADKPFAHQLLALASTTLIWLRHIPNVKGLIRDAKERKRVKRAASRAGEEPE